jgi:hypothetical protein
MTASELLALAEVETVRYRVLTEHFHRLPWWCFRARRQLDVAAAHHRWRALMYIQQSEAADEVRP